MKFNIGDEVVHKYCKTMFGKVKKYVDDKNFIWIVSGKELLCHEDHYRKVIKQN